MLSHRRTYLVDLSPFFEQAQHNSRETNQKMWKEPRKKEHQVKVKN